jgi:hypothetical protein
VSGSLYEVWLGPADRIVGRPFADPRRTVGDLHIMNQILAVERRVARAWQRQATLGMSIFETSQGRRRQLLAVPNQRALVGARDVTAVGFFGTLRLGVDHLELFEMEKRVLETFPAYAEVGLLSYFDMGPQHGRYGNLILFDAPEVPEAWHHNPTHNLAVAAAPRHYRSIRLHKGIIPGPFMGEGCVVITRTTYLEFDDDQPWRAVRLYGVPAWGARPAATAASAGTAAETSAQTGQTAEQIARLAPEDTGNFSRSA